MNGMVKVHGGGTSARHGKAPAITYSGKHTQRLIQYDGVPYAEFELYTSGTFDVAAGKSYQADIMLVGAGGNGGGASGSYYGDQKTAGGAGGGAGYVAYASTTVSGSTSVTIGASGGAATKFGTYTAGGGGTPGGFTGTYYLYNEPDKPYGKATAATQATSVFDSSRGGNGGNGFCLHGSAVSAKDGAGTVTAGAGYGNYSGGTRGMGGTGYGAGGGGQGGARAGFFDDNNGNIIPVTASFSNAAGAGAQGVALVRVKL